MESAFLKGMAVLETLALAEKPRGVSELASELNLTKSNVHRLLQALAQRGFVTKDSETNRYKMTLKLWELGAHILSRIDLKETSSGHLRDLAKQTTETVHLSVLDDAGVIYIDKIDSLQPVRAYSRIGGRAPAYCVATGKALLAHQPASAVARIAENMERFTSRSLKNAEELSQDLARVRQLGYAVNRGEWREGVCGIAAPIRDSSKAVIAAVGLSGPAVRMNAGVMRDLAPIVMQTAAAISRSLGDTGVLPSTYFERTAPSDGGVSKTSTQKQRPLHLEHPIPSNEKR
jgi:DNA-binding IclR family transcriptional regulator